MAAQLEAIKEKYTSNDFVFELVEISNGFQFLSKKEYHELLNQLIIHREKKKLSTVVDESAVDLPTMFVSGGRRGLDIEVAPSDLIRVLDALSGAIATSE